MKTSILSFCLSSLLGAHIAFAGSMTGSGGVTGGGGNTHKPSYMNPQEVASIVTHSKASLMSLSRWIGHVFYNHKHNMPVEFQKLYATPEFFEKLLDDVVIEVKLTEACYGPDGSFNDGWAYEGTNKICISAQRIARNVPASDMRVQVIGLIYHEISHLAGLSEEEATHVQDFVVKQAPQTSPDPQTLAERAYFDMTPPMDDIAKQLENGDMKTVCSSIKNLSKELMKAADRLFVLSHDDHNPSTSIIPSILGSFHFIALQYKSTALEDAACYLSNPNDQNFAKSYQRYTALFNNGAITSLSVPEFSQKLYGNLSFTTDPTNSRVPFIANVDAAKKEAQELAALITKVRHDVFYASQSFKQSFTVTYK